MRDLVHCRREPAPVHGGSGEELQRRLLVRQPVVLHPRQCISLSISKDFLSGQLQKGAMYSVAKLKLFKLCLTLVMIKILPIVRTYTIN